MPRSIPISIKQPGHDRVHYVTEDDIRVVLNRLPPDTYACLRHIHLNDRSRGARIAGYTTTRGRREVTLCAMPPRMSFTRYLVRGQSPATFGAVRGAQWPRLALRRFTLYDVLLHEIGHLQVVDPKARNPKRRWAGETLAQKFADSWRKRLWATPFEHEDPVHNAPTPEELEQVRAALQA